jgi:dehydrogenase/reductase SDR family member 12
MYTARLHADDLELEHEEFDGPRFYAHAKRVQVIVAEQLAERWRADGIAVYSMHPGWVRTGGLEQALPRFTRLTRPLLRDPQQGADTAVWLLAAPEAPAAPSGFWHDRRPRPLHRLPRTRESADERLRAWDGLVRMSGFDDRAADADADEGRVAP